MTICLVALIPLKGMAMVVDGSQNRQYVLNLRRNQRRRKIGDGEMHFSRFAAFVALAADVVADNKCSSNNCLRAVKKITTGRNGTADCLSFFQVTATPSPRTSTTTVTITTSVRTLTITSNSTASRSKTASTTISLKPHDRRDVEYEAIFDNLGQIQPLEERQLSSSRSTSSLPKYATPCSSLAAYSSACSCLGITRATTTAAVSTLTRTLTTTKTVANTTLFANHTSSLGNSTVGQGWNASSSPTIWKSDSRATLGTNPKTTIPSGSSSQLPTISSTSSVVHVFNTTTLITIITPVWTNTSSSSRAQVLGSSGFTGRFANSTSLPSSVAANTTAASDLEISTSARTLSRNSTTPRWQNTTTSAQLLANSTRPLWLNTSFPTRAANITTGRWLNTTSFSPVPTNTTSFRWLNSTFSPIPTNTTSFRWLNSTMLPNATTTRWLNTSSSIPTPTPTIDTTCGETSNPFALQVSQPGGMYDGWYVHVSGNGLLFTSVRSSASSFSVEASGHLCAVGRLDRNDRPRIAAVGIRDPSSDVWLVESRTLEVLDEDYAAVKCTRDGSLSCAANATNPASHWLGCGLQLDLSTDGGGTVPVRGLNCSSLALSVVATNQ